MKKKKKAVIKKVVKKVVKKPEKQKKKVTSQEALAILNQAANEKDLRIAQRIEQVLREEGVQFEVIHKIITVPIR